MEKNVYWNFWHFWMPTNWKPNQNQDSQFSWLFQTTMKTVRKSKNVGLRELFLPENDFKTWSKVNFRKWLKNWKLWFLEFYFYLKYIFNKDDIGQRGNSSWSVNRRKKTYHFKIKKSIMVAQNEKLYCCRQH